MSPDGCEALPRFLDGEMPPGEQVRFREHLAGCEACAQAFHDALQLELLGEVTLEEGPVRAAPPDSGARAGAPRWVWPAGGAVLAAGLGVVVLLLCSRPGGAEDGAWLVPGDGRHLEARVTYAPVDSHHRRYVPDRSGASGEDAPVTALPLHALSRMEARKDFHGIATAYLLHGAPLQARAFLERMPRSADRACDLAVIALERARATRPSKGEGTWLKQTYLEEALQLLEEVLREAPAHPQALWNRALVLREMGLTLRAAEAFEAVAKQGEPGWSEEAWGQAHGLREDFQARGREWMTDPGALQAGAAWAPREARDGAWWMAEQRLKAALDACEDPALVERCLGLEGELTRLYLGLHRPVEALQYAWSGWERARAARAWRFEQEFLQELADVTRFQHAFASARAYLEESLARMPEECEPRSRVYRTLASVDQARFRPDGARGALDRALACARPLELTGALVLSDLARARPAPGDEDHLRRALSALRRDAVPPGREALLLFIEGQFELARSRPAGHELLWRAVALAEQWPEDVDARAARARAYGALISDAARTGAWSEVLALHGRQLRLTAVPERCMLSVSVHHERTVVLARGPSGPLQGHYDASRTGPPREAESLVPEHLVDALRACGHVDVLALPPVHGLTGLLPLDLAWSYRVGRRAPPRPPSASGAASHLVVTDVADPPSLKLPRLPRLQPPRVPDPRRVELRGSQATPSRVLAAMEDASEVELHAHGLFSSEVSDASLVVLARDGDGRYALTADRVRRARLSRAPVVLLATCSAAKTTPYLHEPFSLPVAFIEAGASVVLASTTDIPDTAGGFFEEVRELIRGRVRPSAALRDARARWLKEHPGDAWWLPHVLLFE